jgi:hypothetical protein
MIQRYIKYFSDSETYQWRSSDSTLEINGFAYIKTIHKQFSFHFKYCFKLKHHYKKKIKRFQCIHCGMFLRYYSKNVCQFILNISKLCNFISFSIPCSTTIPCSFTSLWPTKWTSTTQLSNFTCIIKLFMIKSFPSKIML